MGFLCPLVLPIILSLQVEMKAVHIEGAEALSTLQIEQLLRFTPGDTIDEEEIAEKVEVLLTKYRDLGYIQATIEWRFEEGTFFLAIEEGNLYHLGRIEFTGNRFFSSEYIASNLRVEEGDIFSDAELEEEIERLLDKYEDNGFPFCAIRPEGIELDEKTRTINLTLRIDEGPLTRIESVQIDGNSRTRKGVILRELGIREEEVYSRVRLQKGVDRLKRLNVLTVSDYVIEQTRVGWVRAIFPVEERSSNSVEGALAWAPKAQLTGSVDLRADNLFGTLRSLSLQWVRRKPVSYYLRLGYEEPWLFGAPLSGRLNFETEVEDTSYTLHSGSVHLLSRTLDPFELGIGIGIDRAVAFTSHTPSSNGAWVALNAAVDTSDPPITPQKGFLYALESRVGLKRTHGSDGDDPGTEDEFYSFRARLTLENSFPLGRNLLYVFAGGGILASKDASVWEMFKLGGAKTVRGYREEQFVAPQVGWSNIEYRLLVVRSGWLAPFLDLGYYRDGTSEWLYGWGLGMGLTSRIGLVTIHYALGKEDSIGNGKVHINLTGSF